MKKASFVLVIATITIFSGCSLFTVPKSWVHTLNTSDVSYVPDSPYGYYDITYYDSRFSMDNDIEVWLRDADGDYYQLPAEYDSTIGVYYLLMIIGDGYLQFNTGFNPLGKDLLIFYEPASFEEWN